MPGVPQKGRREWGQPLTGQMLLPQEEDMFNDQPDVPHDTDEDGSYIELRIEFDVTDDGEGTLAAVHTHVHHVPDTAVVDALLVVAKMIAANRLQDSLPVLPSGIPERMREALKNMLAGAYVKQRLESPSVANSSFVEALSVPDDASELFKD